MTRGHPWQTLDDRIRVACAEAGGLYRLSADTGVAYSTLTARVRKMGLRAINAPRPTREKLLPPSASRPRGSIKLDPTLPVVRPPGVKVQHCPSVRFDPRFQCEPESKPHGAGFASLGVGRYMEE